MLRRAYLQDHASTPLPEIGETLTLELDWERRYAMMRLHTALHVLSCVVVAPVTGGSIAPDKGRLDFDIDMSLLDAAKIEQEANALISRAVQTETVWITDEELDARPDLVKTMSVQPPRGAGRVRLLSIPEIDLQPCGGTHVRNIAEVGGIRVLKIRSEGLCHERAQKLLSDHDAVSGMEEGPPKSACRSWLQTAVSGFIPKGCGRERYG